MGRNRTAETPVVRLSFLLPILLGPLAMFGWRSTGFPLDPAAILAGAGLVVAWLGFVPWRIAANANRRDRLFHEVE